MQCSEDDHEKARQHCNHLSSMQNTETQPIPDLLVTAACLRSMQDEQINCAPWNFWQGNPLMDVPCAVDINKKRRGTQAARATGCRNKFWKLSVILLQGLAQ